MLLTNNSSCIVHGDDEGGHAESTKTQGSRVGDGGGLLRQGTVKPLRLAEIDVGGVLIEHGMIEIQAALMLSNSLASLDMVQQNSVIRFSRRHLGEFGSELALDCTVLAAFVEWKILGQRR